MNKESSEQELLAQLENATVHSVDVFPFEVREFAQSESGTRLSATGSMGWTDFSDDCLLNTASGGPVTIYFEYSSQATVRGDGATFAPGTTCAANRSEFGDADVLQLYGAVVPEEGPPPAQQAAFVNPHTRPTDWTIYSSVKAEACGRSLGKYRGFRIPTTGVPPPPVHVVSGKLPQGLRVLPATGQIISGPSSSPGTRSVMFEASNGGAVVTTTYAFDVVP
ncbi:MAG TPA: hypothetical protein VEJ87_05195 [Acidimicrobiales bacterium]|nr:hypothetical protein [Acidimicrobiales bacterium]